MAKSDTSTPDNAPPEEDTAQPTTNRYMADILLDGAANALRDTLRNRMVIAQYDPDKARDAIDGRTVLTSLTLYGASKLAGKSVPGIALVAGGLVLKALYDRGKARQLAEHQQEVGEK